MTPRSAIKEILKEVFEEYGVDDVDLAEVVIERLGTVVEIYDDSDDDLEGLE